MKMKRLSIIAPLLALVIIASCSKDAGEAREEKLVLPEEVYDYTVEDSNSFFWTSDNTPEDNPVTDNGATLGRVLFHDKRMSKSNIISCSSCHLPEFGFGDDKSLSDGFVNEKTIRNSMPIINAKYKNNFFWDGREVILEQQVLRPVSDHIEMGIEEGDLAPRLELLPYYADLFEAAFGDSEITRTRIASALSQYLRSMETSNSKYDLGLPNGFQNFTASELNGRNLFFEELHCGSCHNGHSVGGWGSSNIGLEMEYADDGYGGVPGNSPSLKGMFSIPSLRNVELTGPYMHDGRYATLEEVIDHYASGVQPHVGLDNRLEFTPFGQWGTGSTANDHFTNSTEGSEVGEPLRFVLTQAEQQDLINFMKTLTDHDYITDVRFSNPFVYEE